MTKLLGLGVARASTYEDETIGVLAISTSGGDTSRVGVASPTGNVLQWWRRTFGTKIGAKIAEKIARNKNWEQRQSNDNDKLRQSLRRRSPTVRTQAQSLRCLVSTHSSVQRATYAALSAVCCVQVYLRVNLASDATTSGDRSNLSARDRGRTK